ITGKHKPTHTHMYAVIYATTVPCICMHICLCMYIKTESLLHLIASLLFIYLVSLSLSLSHTHTHTHTHTHSHTQPHTLISMTSRSHFYPKLYFPSPGHNPSPTAIN